MAKLVARSITDPDKGWERTLPTQPVTLGRLPTESVLAAEWDRRFCGERNRDLHRPQRISVTRLRH